MNKEQFLARKARADQDNQIALLSDLSERNDFPGAIFPEEVERRAERIKMRSEAYGWWHSLPISHKRACRAILWLVTPTDILMLYASR